MTLDEHIRRLSERKTRPSKDFEDRIVAWHQRIDEYCHTPNRLARLFEHLVTFFGELPSDVDVFHLLQLGTISEEMRAVGTGVSFIACLHAHVSNAYMDYLYLGRNPYLISPGEAEPTNIWVGPPVCIASAVNTCVLHAKANEWDLAEELDATSQRSLRKIRFV